jgi:23S rRNA (uracil1939-C5)-methyltransferase
MEVKITALSHEGRGITHINGKTTFVETALPDEIVEIELTKKHSRYNEARVINIIEPSPHRVTPKCIHFDLCGGCQLQHINIEEQMSIKQKTLLEQLKHIGQVETKEILLPLKSISWGYRYKARLSVKYVEKKQKLLIGFHEKNGRFIADLTRCEVLIPKIGLSIELLRELILSLSLFKSLPQIEIACDDNHCALIFRCLTKLTESDKELFIKFAKENNFLIYIEPNKPEKVFKLWPDNNENDLIYYYENIQYNFHPSDFTQINPYINQQMVKLALELLDLKNEDIVLDLFCGLGNFSLPIAKHCQSVIGIEGDNTMATRATENALKNNIQNTQFYSANLFEPDKNAAWIKKHYDKILLDPPRTGAIEILPYFAKWKPKLIVYVSCNPATLARDVGELVNKYGYYLKKAGIMDMFPHTKHVESIVLLSREE